VLSYVNFSCGLLSYSWTAHLGPNAELLRTCFQPEKRFVSIRFFAGT